MHCHLWPDLTASCASPAPGQKSSVKIFWCCHETHFLFCKIKVNTVKPGPWTNSCVISIQRYLLCHTRKQHRLSHSSTHQKPSATHLSSFVSKDTSLSPFPIKWILKGKNALSFSLKIHAIPQSKTSELKMLIKEEETWELQCALLSKGLQLTSEEEEGWARNVLNNKPLFYCQLSPSLLLTALSNVKSDCCYLFQNTLHQSVHFKKKNEAAAPDLHAGRDQPRRAPGCAPGSQLLFTFVPLAHFKLRNPTNLCARYCVQAPVCSQGRLATLLVKYHATHAALCLSPSSLVGMQSEPGGAMERQKKTFKKTGRETAQKEQ